MNVNLKSILDIDQHNNFLKYIVERIQKDTYRGVHISQHNRYDLDYVIKLIESIYKFAENDFFEIPRGDYSEREKTKKYDIQNYPIFKNIVDEIKKHEGKGSYNSIKKNFFVDFHRMGIIKRYDKNFNQTDPFKRQIVYHAKLSNRAIKLLNAETIFEKYRFFTDFLDILFKKHLSGLADLIYNSNYKESQISVYEFMFILSDTQLSNVEKVKLLNDFNSLKKYQKERLISLLRSYANPNNFQGEKTDKRDFHNWINESQQILSLMKQTSYFQVDSENKYFTLNIGNLGIYSKNIIVRSQSVKKEYFKLHNFEKKNDFELHHIIPISKSRNKREVKDLDNVKNLIYLHKDKHKEITVKNNKNVYLFINKNEVIFCDFELNKICSKNNFDSLYSSKDSITKMLDEYNKMMLKKIYDYDYTLNCKEYCV